MKSCIFNWSGGKDSSLALYHCLQNPELDIKYLVTTINDAADRISMHGVRTELLIKQAESIGIPLYQIRLPEMPGMTEYDEVMRYHLTKFRAEGITHSIFGDIFLEDLKAYRDARLAEVGLTGIIACTRGHLGHLAGKEISRELVAALPPDVDVCGENGEFHTFTFKGPIFSKPIAYKTGEMVFKEYKAPKNAADSCTNTPGQMDGFWYCDLLPVKAAN